MKCIRMFLRTKEGHILLAEREKDRGQCIEGCQFARIGLIEPDMSQGLRDGVRLALLLVASSSLALFHGVAPFSSLVLTCPLSGLFLFSHSDPVLHILPEWNEHIASMDHGADLDA